MPLPVVAIVFPLVLFGIMAVVLFVAYRRAARAIDELSLPVVVRCGACGVEFRITTAELRGAKMTKSVSRTSTRVHGPALVTRKSYSRYQKRLTCPACGEHGWCEVLNIGQLQAASTRVAIKYLGGALVLLILLGFVLNALSNAIL